MQIDCISCFRLDITLAERASRESCPVGDMGDFCETEGKAVLRFRPWSLRRVNLPHWCRPFVGRCGGLLETTALLLLLSRIKYIISEQDCLPLSPRERLSYNGAGMPLDDNDDTLLKYIHVWQCIRDVMCILDFFAMVIMMASLFLHATCPQCVHDRAVALLLSLCLI